MNDTEDDEGDNRESCMCVDEDAADLGEMHFEFVVDCDEGELDHPDSVEKEGAADVE